MSNPVKVPHNVVLADWVKQVAGDPIRHRERQITEILLHAIGLTPALKETLVLKGGILMSLAHGSYRQTGDVDFTAIVDPQPYANTLRAILDAALARAAAELGYVDIVSAVQRFEYLPRQEGFENFTAPALKLTIGYAKRGTPDEVRLKAKHSTQALQIDVSFKESVLHETELTIESPNVSLRTYKIEEIIGEKLRALLQQPIRNRSRRQDVYDIDYLISLYAPNEDLRAAILQSLCVKSDDRNVEIGPESLENPEVKSRAEAEWDTMRLELGRMLPKFEDAFARVLSFYKKLPWELLPKG